MHGSKVMDWVAWDFDLVMGSGPLNMSHLLIGDDRDFSGIFMQPLTKAVLNIPTYQTLFESQLHYITNHLLLPDISFPVIDSLVVFLKPDIMWDKSLPRLRNWKSFSDVFDMDVHIGDDGKLCGNDYDKLMKSDAVSMPLGFDLATGIDFVFRMDANVTIDEAITGPTNHTSLLAVKEFIQ